MMGRAKDGYAAWLDRFVMWAEGRPEIRTAIVLGSRARQERPADQWSDLDLWLVVTDAEPFFATSGWLEALGRPILSFVEGTAAGNLLERRVLFAGGLDVDFIPVPRAAVEQMMQQGGLPADVRQILAAGYRVVVDKDGFAPALPPEAALALPRMTLPAPGEFDNFVNDFLYHVIWTAKKLGRGELWTAHECLDGYLKHLLVRMLGWHALALHGPTYQTWHKSRFLEQWADARAVEAFPSIFAGYDLAEMQRALTATHGLFRELAVETAAHTGLTYPDEADAAVSALAADILEGRWSPNSTLPA